MGQRSKVGVFNPVPGTLDINEIVMPDYSNLGLYKDTGTTTAALLRVLWTPFKSYALMTRCCLAFCHNIKRSCLDLLKSPPTQTFVSSTRKEGQRPNRSAGSPK